MTRSKQLLKNDTAPARCEAEDRIVVYLGKISPRVAAATILNVEWSLAMSWERAQNEMLRQGDTGKVFGIFPDDIRNMRAALNKIPTGTPSNDTAEKYIVDILGKFPPDSAWLIARNVRQYMVWKLAVHHE